MSAIFLSPKIAHIAKYGLHEEDHTPNGKCEAKGGDDCLVFVRDGGIILIRGEARGEGPVAEGLKSVEKIGGRVDDAEEARFGDHLAVDNKKKYNSNNNDDYGTMVLYEPVSSLARCSICQRGKIFR